MAFITDKIGVGKQYIKGVGDFDGSINIDGSIYVYNRVFLGADLNKSYVDASLISLRAYIDGSLINDDISLAVLTSRIDASFAALRTYTDASFAALRTYVDGSISNIDVSLARLDTSFGRAVIRIDASFAALRTYVDGSISNIDVSLARLDASLAKAINRIDASVIRIDAYNIIQDTSLYNVTGGGSIYYLKTGGRISGDVSISSNLYIDGTVIRFKNGADRTLELEDEESAHAGYQLNIIGADGSGTATATYVGGNISILSGTGGAYTSLIGGKGGNLLLKAGKGGGPPSQQGGTGGDVSISGGIGGNTIDSKAGDGGNVYIYGGAPGSGVTATPAGGNVYIYGGAAATGIYAHGNIIMSTRYVPYMFFVDGENGKIGIGTNSPYSILDVSGTIRVTSNITPTDGSGLEMLYNKGTGIGYLQSFNRTANHYTDLVLRGATVDIGAAAGPTYRKIIDVSYGALIINEDSNDVDFRVESDGNANMLFVDGLYNRVGIGTGIPSTTLDIVGDTSISGTLKIASLSTKDGIAVSNQMGLLRDASLTFDGSIFQITQNLAGMSAGLYLNHADNTYQSNCVLSLNVLGGGVTNLYAYSDIAGNIWDVSSAGSSVLYAGSGSSKLVVGIDSDSSIYFITNKITRVVIDNKGFAAYMSSANTNVGYFHQRSTTGHGIKVAIAATSGTIYNIFSGYNSNTSNVANLRADGTWWAADYQLSSDITLKDNIEVVKNGLEIALALKPVYFTWRSKIDSYKHVGFIAQDVEKVRPELVSYDASRIGSVSYTKISAINNAAIHELYQKIKDLEDRIKILENGARS
jgi:hypothetical protein